MRRRRNAFEEDKLYYLHASFLRRLNDLKNRLYTEKRMSGDEMRDAAQLIEACLAYAKDIGPQ